MEVEGNLIGHAGLLKEQGLIKMFGKDDLAYHSKRGYEWITCQYSKYSTFESSESA